MCGWIAWVIVGAIAGWLASIVMKTNKDQGLIADIIVGIIGAFIGGWVLDLLNITGGSTISGINLTSLFTAFLGAVIFLAVLQALRGQRGGSKKRR
jgi:uncharacterized membrane protein YeaQ/YmgE (transglycosylase-associated protein family)